MTYRNEDLPIEYYSPTSDPFRTGMLLKLGNLIATGVIVIGILLISYAISPGLFN